MHSPHYQIKLDISQRLLCKRCFQDISPPRRGNKRGCALLLAQVQVALMQLQALDLALHQPQVGQHAVPQAQHQRVAARPATAAAAVCLRPAAFLLPSRTAPPNFLHTRHAKVLFDWSQCTWPFCSAALVSRMQSPKRNLETPTPGCE